MAGNLIRLDTKEYGIIYTRPECVRMLGDKGNGVTVVGILMGPDHAMDVTVDGEVDEVAAMFETNAPGMFRIYRVN